MGNNAMNFDNFLYAVHDRIATITLNRPERLNAITFELARELPRVIDQAAADPGVHVIVLQGAGKGFCGGYDLQDYAETHVENPCGQDEIYFLYKLFFSSRC